MLYVSMVDTVTAVCCCTLDSSAQCSHNLATGHAQKGSGMIAAADAADWPRIFAAV